MKFTFRIVTVLVLLAAPAGIARADYHDLVFCGDLPAADCLLLEAAQENSTQQTSGSGVLDMDLLMRDLDAESMGEFSLGIDADVAWSGDLGGLEEMGAASLGMMNDPDAMMTMLGELLAQFNGRLSISVQVPQGLPGMMGDDIPEGLLSGVTMETRLVDGILYLDLSSLATIVPDGGGVPSGWFGIGIMDLMETAALTEDMSEGMKDRRSGDAEDMAEAGAEMEATIEDMEAMIAAWSDPDFLSGFMSVERLDDQTVADQLVAVFRTGIDLVALFNSDALYGLLQASGDMSETDIVADDLQEMSMLMNMFGGGIDIEAITYISIDEALPLRDEFHMVWDLTELMAMTGEGGGAEPYIRLDMQMDYSYPEDLPAVTVPENAFIISPGMLMGAADA